MRKANHQPSATQPWRNMSRVQLGSWVEMIFTAEALRRGFDVYLPMCPDDPVDRIVDDRGKLSRVQVRGTTRKARMRLKRGNSAWSFVPGSYSCTVCSKRNGGRPLTSDDVDVLAVYVIPENTWYILPIGVTSSLKAGITLRAGGKYEEYREAWHELGIPPDSYRRDLAS